MIKLKSLSASLKTSSTIVQSKFGAFRSSNFSYVKEGACQGRNGSSYKVWIVITVVAQSIESNYSIINCKLYLQATAFSNSAFNLNGNNYCYINADAQLKGSNRNIDTRNFAIVLLKDENFPINHETNGSRNFYFSAGFFISSNTLSSGKVDGFVDLPVIPRASYCMFSDLTLEDDLYINTNRSSSNFYHTIDLYIANTKILTRTEVAQDIIIKMSDEEINQVYELMKNTLSDELKIVCVTYNNGQIIGTTETRKLCNIDKEKNKAEYQAGLLQYFYGDIIDTHYGPTENVRGRTRVSITGFDFLAKNHAIIQKIIMRIGSSVVIENEYQSGTTQNIGGVYTPADEEARISLIAVDSRGLESTAYYYLPDSDYVVPQLISARTRRKNGVEAETYLDLEFKYTRAKDNTDPFRSPNILSVTYPIFNGNMTQDITEEVKNGTFTVERETNQYEVGILKVENIQIHNKETGGFPIGQEFTISPIIKIGSQQDPQVVWDELQFYVDINDGKFLDGSFRDYNGNYHSGYHCLPSGDYEHVFEGNVLFKNSVDFQDNAYMIARQIENINVNPGSNHYLVLTVDKSKNIRYEGSKMIFEKKGVYQIRFFVHLANQGVNRRSFINLEFTGGGEFCPMSLRSNDSQNLFGDACYELNATVCVKENTEMDMVIYLQNNETIMGSTVWNDSSTYISIFKVAEYPVMM